MRRFPGSMPLLGLMLGLLLGPTPLTARAGAMIETVVRRQHHEYRVRQAQTSDADVQALVRRAGVPIHHSRQLTPGMHVLFLPHTLYGADVLAALGALRADSAVAFAAVDGRRYADRKS